jgi:hypothetical protein
LPVTEAEIAVFEAWFGGLFDEARGRLADSAMMNECGRFARRVKYWPEASLPATACYFAWGCFRYFCWKPQRRGVAAKILLEAAHASEAFAVAKRRAGEDETGNRYVIVSDMGLDHQ